MLWKSTFACNSFLKINTIHQLDANIRFKRIRDVYVMQNFYSVPRGKRPVQENGHSYTVHRPSWCGHTAMLHLCFFYINPIEDKINVRKLYIGRSQWPRCLRRGSAAAGLLGLWVRIRGHGCLSLVSVVCYQVDVSVLGWSLAQRSPTECGVSECDLNPRQWGGHGPLGLLCHGNIYIQWYY
jgi:hypothetical protein